MRQRSTIWALLVGGSIAGALDILFAITYACVRGSSAQSLLQTVASGLLGESAYSGGWAAAGTGLGLHFLISYLFAGGFLVAARSLRILAERPLVSGVLFGIGVFFVMRLLVLPLSAFPHPVTFSPMAWGLDLLSHMFLFGVPISLANRRAVFEPVEKPGEPSEAAPLRDTI